MNELGKLDDEGRRKIIEKLSAEMKPAEAAE